MLVRQNQITRPDKLTTNGCVAMYYRGLSDGMRIQRRLIYMMRSTRADQT